MKNAKLKRLLSFLMAVSMVMSIVVMPAAATEGETEQHTCSYTETTTATCGAAGIKTKTCSVCDSVITEDDPATGNHSYTETTTATCGAAGIKTKNCSVCGDVVTEEDPATGIHSYENGVCTVCSAAKPCTLAADCDAPQHVEECLSRCNGEAECTNKAHKETCLSQCTGEVLCGNKAHKEGCLSQADCTCIRACSDTKACPVCEGNGECKGAEAVEEIAAVQTLINALPTTYNFSESAAVKVQYDACTEAIAALTEAERAELDLTNYAAAAQPTVIDDSAASIGTEKFNTLNEAFEKASNNSIIVVNKNLTLENPIEVPAGKTVTLDLNGKIISQIKAQTEAYSMIKNNGTLIIQDSGNGGKISYTDNGTTGSVNYVSNTISNYGTLIVKSGTVENGSSTTVASAGYPHAIDNYQGSTMTIQGGTISCATYTAIRQFCNSTTAEIKATITGGTIIGNIDHQNPTKSSAGFGTLTISGGNMNNVRYLGFSTDASKMKINITGGTITGIRGVAANATETILKKVLNITGGTFNNDVSAFLPVGYAQDEDGKVEAFEIKQTTDEKTQVVIPESAGSKITVNETVTSTNVSQVIANDQAAVQEALATITGAAGATGIEISMKVELETYNEQTNTLTFNVAPHVQPVDDKGEKKGDGAPITEVNANITFRLPMPKGTAGKYASVSHKHGNNDAVNIGSYLIEETDGSCYITLSSKQFSEYTATIDEDADAYVAKLSSGASYKSLQDALTAATADDEVILLKSITLPDQNFIQIKENVTLNLNGKTLRGNVLGTLEINGGTYLTNDPNYTDGYKMVGPTGSENFAYISDDAVITIAADGITISSGTMTLGQDMYTDPNHTITVSQGATFIVPAGKTLYIRKSGIANGTLTVNGTIVLVKTEVTEGNFITGTLKAPSGLNVITNIADHKVVYNDGTYAVAEKTYVASIGTTQYESLHEAVTAAQAAEGAQEILLISNVELTSAVVIPTGDSLNLNGKTLKGTVLGTMKMGGGTYYSTTTDTVAMVAPTSSHAAYLSDDAVFVIATDGITISSGSVTLGDNWGTEASHTLTVASGAAFTVPSGKLLLIRGTGIVNGTLTVGGTVELTKTATLKAVTGLNVTTSETDCKVVYENGTYKVIERKYVLGSNDAGLTYTKEYYDENNKTFQSVLTSKAYSYLKLTQDETLNSTTPINLDKDTTIDFSGHKIKGSATIVQNTSDKKLFLKNIANTTDLTLGTGDKAAFDANGNITITVAEDSVSGTKIGYGEIGVTVTNVNGTANYVYSIGIDTLLIVKADGTIKSMSTKIENNDGQVIILRNADGKPQYSIRINDGTSTTQYQYFVVGSSKVLRFETEAFFDGFLDVYVGTTKLTNGVHYTAERGSTIITLKNAYLKTLSKGTHTLTMTFKDGQTVSGNFYVVDTAKPAVTPQTGDIIMTSVVIMVVAAAGLGVLFFLNKKKKK